MTIFRPRHLSVSSVALYAKCPAQFRQRYIDCLVTPNTVPQAWGKAFHKALEAVHRGEDADKTWIAAWNEWDATLAAAGETLEPGKEYGLDLLEMYRKQQLGGVKGEPERRFLLPLPGGKIPVPLLGYIDLPVPSERHYRDFKTTSMKFWNAVKVSLEPQLHVYGWAYQMLYRHRAERAVWVIFSTNKAAIDVYEAVPSPDMFRLFVDTAEKVWSGIEAGRYDGCGECPELCKPKVGKASVGPTLAWEG